MNILIFGATGSIGQHLVHECLSRNHRLTAVLRHPSGAAQLPDEVPVRFGDASIRDDVARLSDGQDVVISATRPPAGQEGLHKEVASSLIEGLRASGTRLLIVGGAGSLTAPDTGQLVVDDERYVLPAWREIALACCAQYAVCRKEDETDWVYLSPPAQIQPGTRTGNYRIGRDELLVDENGLSQISIADLAVAAIDEVERPAHRNARFTVAY